ncbi:MAG: methyltransferase domain-containing protein, partial [Ktedonobacterales bacterium]|nr:methyltransferase domain-containing protein [Ktedonobacterales bacterium]
IDHVQVAMPPGAEARARAFYGDLLGLDEVHKPASLAERGGVWFRCGAQMLHLGSEEDFRPQRKGHPALLVRDVAALRARLAAAGVVTTSDAALPGYERFYTSDPFGNRLECLQPLAPVVAHEEDVAAQAIKDRVRDQFGRAAPAYVASATHAAGADLKRLVELAAPQLTDRALDISTGGGHTALALAPHVAHITASDLTPRMLAAARASLLARGVTNADFVVADAERLPFLDASFELVTARIAPHHYADPAAAMREVARVLPPGGRFILVENIAPEDALLDQLVNEWEKRRDASHVREYTLTEWRALLADAGLRLTDLETARKSHRFAEWVARSRMPAKEAAALERDILAAPERARRYFQITAQDGRLSSWVADYVILRAVR